MCQTFRISINLQHKSIKIFAVILKLWLINLGVVSIVKTLLFLSESETDVRK